MADETDRTHLTRTEARAGQSSHVTRYVLSASLLLIILLFAAILLIWK
ncbi:hypothetical protein [Sphingomonas oleivorans]|nr:hypothetical protein [Sphingomonas oleivorans]